MKKEYILTYLKIGFFILIIAGIVWGGAYYIKNQYEEEKWETTKTNMLLINAKIKILEEKVKIKEKGVSYIGTKISEMQEDESVKKLQENKIIEIESKEHEYYVLNYQDLEKLSLNEIKPENGYYIVDYKTGEVIYSDGIKDKDGNIFYQLSEMENIE